MRKRGEDWVHACRGVPRAIGVISRLTIGYSVFVICPVTHWVPYYSLNIANCVAGWVSAAAARLVRGEMGGKNAVNAA